MTRFALLGDDDDALALARAAAEHPDHEVVWVGDVADRKSDRRLAEVAPGVAVSSDWESLLDGAVADATIVGGVPIAASGGRDDFVRGADDVPVANDVPIGDGNERRVDQLRRLVQAGAALVVVHPFCDRSLVYYELDMIRRESGSVLIPLAYPRWHPGFVQLSQFIERESRGVDSTDGDASNADATQPPDRASEMGAANIDRTPNIGRVEQVAFERALADRSKGSVLWHFARDVDLIRALCGGINKLGAMGTPLGEGAPAGDAAYANLNVHLSGREGRLARWSSTPLDVHSADSDASDGRSAARLTLIGARGRATLNMPHDPAKWSLDVVADGATARFDYPDYRPSPAALERVERALSGESPSPDWMDAARCVDLAETIPQSLRRGRTIELYNETYTEEGSFKGAMGIAGCGLLVLGLLAVLLVALGDMIARQAGLPEAAEVLGKWPHLLLGVFVVFLLLQFFRLAVPKEIPASVADRESKIEAR